MKICFLELMPFPSTAGGGTTHIINLGSALAELGNEVHVISSKPGADLKSTGKIKNIKVHQVGIRHKKFEGGWFYYLYRLFFEIFFVFSALKKIREIKPDIIDCQSPITTSLPASLSSYPFIITCHGIHSLGFEKLYQKKGYKFLSLIPNKIYQAISYYNIRRAKKFVVQGKETLDFYSRLEKDKDKGRTIQNPLNINFWKYSNIKKGKTIFTVARFTEQKALDKLIIAMRELPEFQLNLAGYGELENYLKSIAGKNVNIMGFKKPEEAVKIYAHSLFTILPSRFEGLPYTILESMSCGVIPIVTRVGALPELIKDGENGFLLKNNDPKTISTCVRKAAKSNLKKISKNARKSIVKYYSSEVIAKEYIEVYKEAADM